MCGSLRGVAAGLLALSIVCITPMLARAADLQPNLDRRAVVGSSSWRGCHSVRSCGRAGCGWRQICPRVCTEGISCGSLYGAYGPDGGRSYWGAYTFGWGVR
jgi:hypothetical protein